MYLFIACVSPDIVKISAGTSVACTLDENGIVKCYSTDTYSDNFPFLIEKNGEIDGVFSDIFFNAIF